MNTHRRTRMNAKPTRQKKLIAKFAIKTTLITEREHKNKWRKQNARNRFKP